MAKSRHASKEFTEIEDITCTRVNMNFIFECSARYLTSECKVYIDTSKKGAIYYVIITTVTSSRVKICSFRAKALLVFHWCRFI